jgi:type II secretory pathway component PulC
MVKRHLKFIDDLQLQETLAPYMPPARSRQLGITLAILAAVLVVVTLFDNISTWVSDYKISHAAPAASATAALADEMQLVDNIPNQHLFGEQPVEDTDFLPVTSLQMHLTGIIKNTGDENSRVIISSENQPGKSYSVGDEITSGIKINAINDNNVVLEHNGRFEKLPLVRAPLIFNEKPKSLWPNAN